MDRMWCVRAALPRLSRPPPPGTRAFHVTGVEPIKGSLLLVLQYPNIHILERSAARTHIATFHVPFLRG